MPPAGARHPGDRLQPAGLPTHPGLLQARGRCAAAHAGALPGWPAGPGGQQRMAPGCACQCSTAGSVCVPAGLPACSSSARGAAHPWRQLLCACVQDETLKRVAEKHHKTPADILVRWGAAGWGGWANCTGRLRPCHPAVQLPREHRWCSPTCARTTALPSSCPTPRGARPLLTNLRCPCGARPCPCRPACSWAVQRGTCLPKSTKEGHLRWEGGLGLATAFVQP